MLVSVCCAGDADRPQLRPDDVERVRSFKQPVDVVESLAQELGALSAKYPELGGFPEYSRSRKEASRIDFSKGLRRIKTKRAIRPDDFEPGGISIRFHLDFGELRGAVQAHQVTHFRDLNVWLFCDAHVSEQASANLAQVLDEVLRRHKAYLQAMEDRKANE